MADLVLKGQTVNLGGSGYVPLRVGSDGIQVVDERIREYAVRGKLYSTSVAAVTLPVNAGTLASKFGLYNPPSSGVFLEIVDITIHAVVATTVVSGVGVYYSNGANASGATFTTRSVTENGRLGEGVSANGLGYAAVTHVGTPVLADLIGGWGAVTDGGATSIYKKFNGSLLVPPGTLIAVAMTTAAFTGSGITGVIRWIETPYVAQ